MHECLAQVVGGFAAAAEASKGARPDGGRPGTAPGSRSGDPLVMDRWGTIVSVTSDVQLNSEAFYVRDGESVDGSCPDRAIDRDDSAFFTGVPVGDGK